MIKKTITTDAAIARAENLCSRAEYSEAEMMKKIASWGITHDKAHEIVDNLVDDGFINDERFARAYVNDKVGLARWGRKKIYLSLYQKGISRDLINEAIDNIDAEVYQQNIIDLIIAKGKTIDNPGSYEGKSKILRFMMSRGFESGAVIKMLNKPGLWEED